MEAHKRRLDCIDFAFLSLIAATTPPPSFTSLGDEHGGGNGGDDGEDVKGRKATAGRAEE